MDKRIFAVCSGSGGVGKSTLAVALALGAASAGHDTILLDAAGPARSCDLLLGLENAVSLDLGDVLCGEADMEHTLVRVPAQERLRFCCTSLWRDAPFSEFMGAALALRSMCGTLVIDLPSGQIADEAGLLGERDMRVLLARPDDASLRVTERLLALAAGGSADTRLVLGRVRRELVRRGQQYDTDAVQQILDRPVLGVIPEDETMAARVGKGRRFPFMPAADGQLSRLVRELLKS